MDCYQYDFLSSDLNMQHGVDNELLFYKLLLASCINNVIIMNYNITMNALGYDIIYSYY